MIRIVSMIVDEEYNQNSLFSVTVIQFDWIIIIHSGRTLLQSYNTTIHSRAISVSEKSSSHTH